MKVGRDLQSNCKASRAVAVASVHSRRGWAPGLGSPSSPSDYDSYEGTDVVFKNTEGDRVVLSRFAQVRLGYPVFQI